MSKVRRTVKENTKYIRYVYPDGSHVDLEPGREKPLGSEKIGEIVIIKYATYEMALADFLKYAERVN